MKYLCLIYNDEREMGTLPRPDGEKDDGRVRRSSRTTSRRAATTSAATRSSRRRRRRRCASATARSRPPTGRSPRPRSSSAAST